VPEYRYNRTVVQLSNRRSVRADARRVAIMRAAARVFRARGFADAGMRDIASAADLSLGNLYHYFRGKNELLFFCQDRSADRLLAALTVARRDRRPLPDRLRGMAIAHVLCLVDEVEGSAAHLEVNALPARLRTRIVAKRDQYERGVRALIAGGVRAGVLHVADATIATRAFLGALNWTAHWFHPDGPQSPQHIAEQVADYAVSGLLNRTSEINQQSAISNLQSHGHNHPHRQQRSH
jgi:AcrR family transcriptional regulator